MASVFIHPGRAVAAWILVVKINIRLNHSRSKELRRHAKFRLYNT